MNELKTKSNPDIKIILIGNKNDLEESREISKDTGEQFYKDNNFDLFLETSAKTGHNTDKFGTIFQPCGLYGYDVFYRPTHAVIANPLLKGEPRPRIAKECELLL